MWIGPLTEPLDWGWCCAYNESPNPYDLRGMQQKLSETSATVAGCLRAVSRLSGGGKLKENEGELRSPRKDSGKLAKESMVVVHVTRSVPSRNRVCAAAMLSEGEMSITGRELR